jgi:hypothetical protein
MGRTKSANRSAIVSINEHPFENDFQYVLNHSIQKIYDKAYSELYTNDNYQYLEDNDANDFITHRMNQAGANISPAIFSNTNPSVQMLDKKIDRENLEKALSYLQNTSDKDIKKYMNSVAADRKKFFDYAFFDGSNDTKYVKNAKGKDTKWEFHDSGWTIKKPFTAGKQNFMAEIEPLPSAKEQFPQSHALRILDKQRNKIDQHIIPVFTNNTFSQTAKLVASADQYIKNKYGE